jgi:hypothetical protein
MHRLRQAFQAKSVFRTSLLNSRGTRWRAPIYEQNEK